MLTQLRRLAGRRWFQRWMAFNAGTVGFFVGLLAAVLGGIAIEIGGPIPFSKSHEIYRVVFGFRQPQLSTAGMYDGEIWGLLFVVVPTVLCHGIVRRALSFVGRGKIPPLFSDDEDCLKGFSPSASLVSEATKDDHRIIADGRDGWHEHS